MSVLSRLGQFFRRTPRPEARSVESLLKCGRQAAETLAKCLEKAKQATASDGAMGAATELDECMRYLGKLREVRVGETGIRREELDKYAKQLRELAADANSLESQVLDLEQRAASDLRQLLPALEVGDAVGTLAGGGIVYAILTLLGLAHSSAYLAMFGVRMEQMLHDVSDYAMVSVSQGPVVLAIAVGFTIALPVYKALIQARLALDDPSLTWQIRIEYVQAAQRWASSPRRWAALAAAGACLIIILAVVSAALEWKAGPYWAIRTHGNPPRWTRIVATSADKMLVASAVARETELPPWSTELVSLDDVECLVQSSRDLDPASASVRADEEPKQALLVDPWNALPNPCAATSTAPPPSPQPPSSAPATIYEGHTWNFFGGSTLQVDSWKTFARRFLQCEPAEIDRPWYSVEFEDGSPSEFVPPSEQSFHSICTKCKPGADGFTVTKGSLDEFIASLPRKDLTLFLVGFASHTRSPPRNQTLALQRANYAASLIGLGNSSRPSSTPSIAPKDATRLETMEGGAVSVSTMGFGEYLEFDYVGIDGEASQRRVVGIPCDPRRSRARGAGIQIGATKRSSTHNRGSRKGDVTS